MTRPTFHNPSIQAAAPAAEEILTVQTADIDGTTTTAVFLDNVSCVLDVERCVSRDVIIDTGDVRIMLSKKFAMAVGVNMETLV